MRAMDAAFLAMERRNEPRHLGTVMIFGPGDDGPLTYGVVRQRVDERLDTMPSARRVVVEAPLGMSRPSWATATVDLDVHVRDVALPADSTARGGDADLAEVVAAAHARRLDRRRPLWELHVVRGLSDDRVALYAKVHMAALDDETGVDLMTALLDADAREPAIEPAAVLAPSSDGLAVPGDRAGAGVDQLRRAAGFPVRLAQRAVRSVGEQIPGLADTAAEMARRTPGLELAARLLPKPGQSDADEHPTGRAPRLSFNGPIGPRRRFAAASIVTADVRRLTQHVGCTTNAVVLAVVAGALRRWLLANGELPTSPTVAIVPVLVGEASGDGAHVAGLTMPLPTNVADPAARLERTRTALTAAKQRQATVPASLQQDVAMFAPPVVAAATSRVLDALPHRPLVSPTVNLAVTNVPGPRHTVRVAGRPLLSGHPVLSVSDLTPLHVGVQYGPERIGLGVIADRDHVEDLNSLVDAAPIELAELTNAVIPSRSRRRSRP